MVGSSDKFLHRSAASRRTGKTIKSSVRVAENSTTEIVELKKSVLLLQQQLLQQELRDKAEIHKKTIDILNVDLNIKQLQLKKTQCCTCTDTE